MDPDDALINLLNGVGSYNGFKNTNQKPFLDEAGLPTDSFLQALKHDFSSYTTTGASHQHPRSTQRVHRSNVRNHVTNKASDGSDILSGSDSADEISHSSNSSEFSDDSDNDDESFSTERKISAKREGGPPQNQSFRKHAIESKYDEQLRPRREDIRASQFPFTTSETDICFERENNFRKDRSLKATKNIKDKEKPVRQKRTSQPSEEFRSKNRLLAQSNRSCFVRQKVLSSDNHGAAMVSRVNAPPAAAAAVSVLDEDSDLAKAEADVKIKSLTLRITGQLQTIRVLETQLGELQHSLKLKSLQASQAESRVRLLLEPREKEKVIFLAKSKSKEEARLQQARVGAEDGAERLKVT